MKDYKELTAMQQASVDGVWNYIFEDIKSIPDQNLQLTIFQMLRDSELGEANALQEHNIRKWFDREKADVLIEYFKETGLQPKNYNLVRRNTHNDPDNEHHYPEISQRDLKNYLRRLFDKEIEFLESNGATPLKLDTISIQAHLEKLVGKSYNKISSVAQSKDVKDIAFISLGVSITACMMMAFYMEASIRTSGEKTRLHFALDSNIPWLAKFLIHKGADINAEDSNFRTPLHCAVTSGMEELVKLLIDRKVNVNPKDKFEATPLHLAAKYGMSQIAELLIKAGADVNAQDSLGNTPLHYAAKYYRQKEGTKPGKQKIAEFLINAGADINAQNYRKKTPFDEARIIDHKEVMTLLTSGNKETSSSQDPLSNTNTRSEAFSLNLPGYQRSEALDSHLTSSLSNITKHDLPQLLNGQKQLVDLSYQSKLTDFTPTNLALSSLVILSAAVGKKLFHSEIFNNPSHITNSNNANASNFNEKYSEFLKEQEAIYQRNNRVIPEYETRIVELLKHKATTEEAANWTQKEWMQFITQASEFKDFINRAEKEAKTRERLSRPLKEKDIMTENTKRKKNQQSSR